MIIKKFNKSINALLTPLWCVKKNKGFGQNSNNYLTQGWFQTSVGKSYLSLFPKYVHVTPKCGIQEPIAGCFDAGMGTINFHHCYHKDQRDVNELTHG